MKTWFHRWLLGIMVILLLPGTLLASLFLIGTVCSGIERGFQSSDFATMVILLIPAVLVWWGLWLLAGLGQGVHHMIRRNLLAFYLVVLGYGTFWLIGTVSHIGYKIGIFPNEILITGFAVLILPVLVTLFTKPERKREWNPQTAGGIRPNRWSDRFIAWLASRIR